MKKCYLSGPVTGCPNAEINFSNAELDVFALGMQSVNPMKLSHDHDKEWTSYMREAIAAMMQCECIYMLDGWMDSEGANLEFRLELSFEEYYQKQ